MKSQVSLSFVLLAVAASPVAAQPQGYAPSASSSYGGAPGAPYSGLPAETWGRGGPRVMPPAGAPTGRPGFAPPRLDDAGRMAGQPPMTDPVIQASTVLREGIGKLTSFLAEAETANNLQVAAFLDREIAPYFDFDYMAQWVAGPAYSGMTPEERKALAAQIESDFLGTLSKNLVGYDGQGIEMLRPRRSARGAVSVNVAVMRAGGYPTRLEFRMSDSGDGWKVYDVVANGQSAASYYRTRFQHMARQQLGYVPR